MRRDRSTGGYVGVVLLTFFTLIAAAASFCTLVDPYGMFGMPRVSHVTALKFAAASRLRLSKAYRVALADPATLVTGSSITNLGIDPASAAWQPAHRPVFNLGLDGATLAEQRRYFLNALAVSRPRLVVFFTSFEDMMPQPPGAGFEDGAVQPELRTLDDGRPNPAFPLAHLKDIVSATLSFRALADSGLTLVRQSGAWINYQTDAGFEIHAPEEMYAATQGARAAVDKMNRVMARRMIAWSGHPDWSLEPLDVMIRAARARGADVVVVIPPGHADIVEIHRQLGLADRVEAWRLALVQLVDGEAEALGGHEHVRLWDFNRLSGYTTAAFTARGASAGDDGWFWDTTHFKPELGSLIIGRIEQTGPVGETGPVAQTLGIPVERANEAPSALAFAAAERGWVEAHPDDVERIGALLLATKQDLCRRNAIGCDLPSASLVASEAVAP